MTMKKEKTLERCNCSTNTNNGKENFEDGTNGMWH
jgi:hypothetical protein